MHAIFMMLRWSLQEFVISNTKLDTVFSGCVSAIIFNNPMSNYAVLLLKQAEQEQVITGPLSDCAIGDYLEVHGEWVSHPVHKKQFKVLDYHHLVPKTTKELLVFLSSGAISGIGLHFATLLVDQFGDELVRILDHDPQQLLSVSGIGESKLKMISSSWQAHRDQLSFLQYMLTFDIDVKLAKRIWNQYFSKAFDICKTAPFQLIHDVSGISFSIADKIAGASHRSSDARLSAAIQDIFISYYQSSHVWMQFQDFFTKLNRLLNMDEQELLELLQQRVFSQQLIVVIDNDLKWVTLPQYSDCELAIMNAIDALRQAPPSISIQPNKAVEWVIPRLPEMLSSDQLIALEGICDQSVVILHGGPGTGKTSLLSSYVDIVSKKSDRIICMAPTGKAAKRLSEQIGRRASTIHAMMDYDEKSHVLSPKPLDCDICIIDEMSMVDMMLFNDVMQMIPLGTRLVMVGDPDQLPSIGPGQVFHDMIHKSNIPSFKLTTNHRQKTHQGISSLSCNILKREPIPIELGDDFTMVDIKGDDLLEPTIMQLFTDQIIHNHNVTIHDIQILVPIHKGRFGISNLNQKIAQHIRFDGTQHHPWVVGDRVIQCRNNYSKRVMNGDIGLIESIASDQISIRFHSDLVQFEPSDMQDIQLAYAVSIHKFQGSEAPIIIMPIVKQWGFFMTMDVLYTAVTRAKTHLYVVGDQIMQAPN